MRAIKEVSISVGLVQVPVSMFKSSKTDEINLKSMCECEHIPKMKVVCEHCNEEYSSWYKVPKRAYEYQKGQYIVFTKEELDNLKNEKEFDTLECIKIVDFKKVGLEYNLGECYYLLPADDSNQITQRAYSLFVKALDNKGWALVSKLTMRNKTYRFCIISDSHRNILVAYKLEEKRDLPYSIPPIDVNELEFKQVVNLLESAYVDNVKVEGEKKPILEEIEKRLDVMFKEGIDEHKPMEILADV